MSSLSDEEIDDRWMQFSEYIAHVGKLCAAPDHCSSYYMDWFYMISHPFMSPAQPRDPPRVLLVQQYDTFVEPDVPQQPVAAAAPDETDVDVRRPRHAVVIYIFLYFVFVVLFFILLLTIFIFVFFSLTRMVM